MEFLSNHEQLYQLILQYKYAIIIPLTLVEGPLVMLISGFLVKLGYLEFLYTYIFLMLGDLIADIFWYGVGYYGGEPFIKKFGKYINVTPENITVVKKIFHRYQNRILVISKITMGFGFALVTLITAGLVKVPFKHYLLLNMIGQLFWTALLMGVGFGLGNFYLTVNGSIGKVFTLAFFVIIFFCLIGFGKYIKKRTLEEHIS